MWKWCNDVVAKENLCDCKMYLSLSFDKCENTKSLNDNSILEEISSVNNDSEWFCDSDETSAKVIYSSLLMCHLSLLFYQII